MTDRTHPFYQAKADADRLEQERLAQAFDSIYFGARQKAAKDGCFYCHSHGSGCYYCYSPMEHERALDATLARLSEEHRRQLRDNYYLASRPRFLSDELGYSEYYRKPREMTAADLGLPLGQWAVDWLNATYGDCQPPLWMWLTARPAPPDAPYSFWLVADHG